MNPELREWLGLKPADFLTYGALALAVSLYFIHNPLADILVSGLAVGLAGLSCVVGMKSEPELSAFTNFVKKVSYPFIVLLVLIAILLNFLFWNR